MPTLRSFFIMSSPAHNDCSNSEPATKQPSEPLTPSISDSGKPKNKNDTSKNGWKQRLRSHTQPRYNIPKRQSRKWSTKKLQEYVDEWTAKKIEMGVPLEKCYLPFIENAPRLAECRLCQKFIYPKEKVKCSVLECECSYHLKCAEEKLEFKSPDDFRCPQHVCYMCEKQKPSWSCTRCHLASHDKCAAFPEHIVRLEDQKAVCWKHSTNWPPEKLVVRTELSVFNKQLYAVPSRKIEEIFHRLPLPGVVKDFKIDRTWKKIDDMKPPPYVKIRRNVYLIKKKYNENERDSGCNFCSSDKCAEDCMCRSQCVSCSKDCTCSETCTNRPFRKDKKIKVVMTNSCGWGVVAAEPIDKGEYIIEYIGEVIDNDLCMERFSDMYKLGTKKFYMCKIGKDFIIDSTFKGNSSRFLNHSCDPNCVLEKWKLEGQDRMGIFAHRDIEVGDPLTYDYRFKPFGKIDECMCGAKNCKGILGLNSEIPKNKTDRGMQQRPRTRSTGLLNRTDRCSKY